MDKELAREGEKDVRFDLELDRAIALVKECNAKTVCVQLPDGLKPESGTIATAISEGTGARVFIWLGSCYGACDIPIEVKKLDCDLLIQWGHSEFR